MGANISFIALVCIHMDADFTLHGLPAVHMWPDLDNDCLRDFPEHCSYRDGFQS